jgi:hypothetical protein
MFDVARFALKIKLYRFGDQAVFMQALLSELLNKSGSATGATVVQGYCTAYGESCYHVWVEDDKGVVTDLTQFLFPEYQITLTKEPIEGAAKDQLTADLFDIYKSDQKEFWKKASRKFLDFRAKCHTQVSKTSR